MDDQSDPNETPIALQLWTIREAMAADADEALRGAKAAGFSAVELAPLPPDLAPARLAELLSHHGLTVVSIHGDLPTRDNISTCKGLADALGCSKIIWHGWPRDARFDSLEGVRELASAFEEAGRIARDDGLRFGLHNHWWEFEPVGGAIPIRLFDEVLHPDIFWQLDVYWAQTAGAVPAGVIADLGPRLGSIHWKDGPCVRGEPMVPLGRGVVDLRRILAGLTRRVDWVVELDECATDPLEAARQGLLYLESSGKGATGPSPAGGA